MKKALVLGVGNAQVDLICYLKDAGWWVIGCSYRHEGRGLRYIDQFELINITDIQGIRNIAVSQKVDLIYSIGSDLAMPTATRLSPELGLPSFVSYEIAELLQNKVMLRNFLAANNISPIQFTKIKSQSDLDRWSIFPAIIKPVDNQGQRGVILTDSIQDARKQLENSLSQSRSRTVIIEEYLEGPEISANTFVLAGKVVFCAFSDRLVVEGFAGGIPKGHVLPAKLCSEYELLEAKKLVENCIHALSIENGPVYFQMKLTANGPRIVELTPRLDGCHMWRLIKMGGGVDLLAASVKLLAGENTINFKMNPGSDTYHLHFFLCPPGQVFSQTDYPIQTSKDFAECYYEYYYYDGEIIRPINGKLEKVGFTIEPECAMKTS